MEFLFQILIFAVMAIIGAAVNGDKNAEKAEKFDVKGLLNSAKEAFQDADVPTPPAKTPEELMNEGSWEKLTSSLDELPDPDDLFSPVGAVTRLFDLGKGSDTDLDDAPDDDRDGESHYFSPDETGEGHVASVGLSREKQLEQLKTWREAGLIDEDEYKERKRKIKRG